MGWGVFGGARDDDQRLQPSGTYRSAGHNIIDSIGGLTAQSPNQNGYLIMDFDAPDDPSMNSTGSGDALPLEFAFTGGDSGGGVFISVGGEFHLAGIISTSEHPSVARQTRGRYGSIMYAVRVSNALAWIESMTGHDQQSK